MEDVEHQNDNKKASIVKHRTSKLKQFSVKQRKNVPDTISAGKRKKKSSLHGHGASKLYEAKNWYYSMLDYSWCSVMSVISLAYTLAIMFWCLMSLPFVDRIECEIQPDVFAKSDFDLAFIFASSNMVSLSYGMCFPSTYGMYMLGLFQQYFAVILQVTVFSVIVSKFQIPKPDVIFSEKVLVSTRNGNPVLLIRVGNRRANLLYDTRVFVSMLQWHTTPEGEKYIKYQPLQVEFPPTLTAVSTIQHQICEDSPIWQHMVLHGSVDISGIALSVSFIGHCSVYNQELACTTQYKGSDIFLSGLLFDDMMEKIPKGKGLRANFEKFNCYVSTNIPVKDIVSSKVFHQEDSRQLTNDVSGVPVVSTLPATPIPGRVYLLHGTMSIRNKSVRVCPYSRIIYLCLHQSTIDYEVIDIDWENKLAWFVEMSSLGRGQTPAIHVDGKWIHNTRDIISCLRAKFKEKMHPLDLPHHLPCKPLALYDTLQRISFSLLLVTPERFREMSSSVAPCPTVSYGVEKAVKLHSIKFVSSADEFIEEGTVNILIPVKLRGAHYVKFSLQVQQVELLLQVAKIGYRQLMYNDEDTPSWIPSDVCVCIDGTKHLGLEQIANQIIKRIGHKAEVVVLLLKQSVQIKSFTEKILVESISLPPLDIAINELFKKVNILNHPFLGGAGQFGYMDACLGPVLRVLYYGLSAISIKLQAHSNLAVYISLLENLSSFRATCLSDAPVPFVQLKLFQTLKSPHVDLGTLLIQENEAISSIDLEMGNDVTVTQWDGSISKRGGVSPPTLEANTLYMCIGGWPRGDTVVRVCPYSRVVEMVLAEASIPHEIILIDLMNKPRWFKESTCPGGCPKMYFNGVWTSESQVILDKLKMFFPDQYAAIDKPFSLDTEFLEGHEEMSLHDEAHRIGNEYVVVGEHDENKDYKRSVLLHVLDALNDHLLQVGTKQDHEPLFADEIALLIGLWANIQGTEYFHDDFDLEALGYPAVREWFEAAEKRKSWDQTLFPFSKPFFTSMMAKFHGKSDNNISMTPLIIEEEKQAAAKMRSFIWTLNSEELDDCLFGQYEMILGDIQQALKLSSGSFLCGEKIGMADILVISALYFTENLLFMVHNYAIEDSKFDAVHKYMVNFEKVPGLNTIFSPIAPILSRIHISYMMKEKHPHIGLTENEISEMRNRIRTNYLSRDLSQNKTLMFHFSNGVSSNRSTASTLLGDDNQMDDLLFCL